MAEPSAPVNGDRVRTEVDLISPASLTFGPVAPGKMSLPYPNPTSEAVSGRMRRNSQRDTGPELAVRSALHARGLRFRKHLPVRAKGVLVRPDVVFTRDKVAVFIDGCFWHCCPVHGNVPRANGDYWKPKLERNILRDRRVDQALEDDGWLVIRAWEHEPTKDVTDRVSIALDQRGSAQPAHR